MQDKPDLDRQHDSYSTTGIRISGSLFNLDQKITIIK